MTLSTGKIEIIRDLSLSDGGKKIKSIGTRVDLRKSAVQHLL